MIESIFKTPCNTRANQQPTNDSKLSYRIVALLQTRNAFNYLENKHTMKHDWIFKLR